MSAAACLRADRSSRLQRPKSSTTLVPSSRARIPSRTRRPSITSDAEAGFCGPQSAVIHSSLVSRRALCSASMRCAAGVFPVPGHPTVRNNVGRCICPCLASKLYQLARRNRPARLISTRATVAPVRCYVLRRWRRRPRSLDLNSSRRVQAQFARVAGSSPVFRSRPYRGAWLTRDGSWSSTGSPDPSVSTYPAAKNRERSGTRPSPRPVLLRASRSRSRLHQPRLREIVPDGGLHDRLERLFIELLVLRDIDRPRLAQELRVEELLRVRKARARGEREPHPLLKDDPDTHHPVVRPDGRAQWVAGPLPLHILPNLGVRVVDDLAELRQHRAAPIARLRNQLIDRSRSSHVSATLLGLSGLGRAGGPRGGRYRVAARGT